MSRRKKLLAWVGEQHKGQLIKRTTIPYLHHLITVAEMADVMPLAYETGLCHDLLEKTEVTPSKLQTILKSFGYNHEETELIIQSVTELTDVFTKATYPGLSKSDRKEKEAQRLITTAPLAQTIKYADLMDNVEWMLDHDLPKAKKY